jgi:hypothetical protein
MAILADKGLAGRAFAQAVTELQAMLVRPNRAAARLGHQRLVQLATGRQGQALLGGL